MTFRFTQRVPPPPLSDFVESLWIAQGHVSYGRERILPNGKAVLIFNLGAPFAMTAPGSEPALCRAAWLSGPQSGAILNQPLAETDVVGVTFKPGGAAPFFAHPLSETADRIVAADLIWGSAAAALRERLHDAADDTETFALVEDCLRRHLTERWCPPALLRYGIACLKSELTDGLQGLSHELDISHKHLISLFHRYVGLTPKTWAQVARFNRVLDALNAPPRPRLDQLALDCGYYDQAHFNRDFARFSGTTPGIYLKQRAAAFGSGGETDESGLFVPYD